MRKLNIDKVIDNLKISRKIGIADGKFEISDEAFDKLDDEIIKMFEVWYALPHINYIIYNNWYINIQPVS